MKAGLAIVAPVGGLDVERIDYSRIITHLTNKTFLTAKHTGEHVLLGQTNRLFEVDEEGAVLNL